MTPICILSGVSRKAANVEEPQAPVARDKVKGHSHDMA